MNNHGLETQTASEIVLRSCPLGLVCSRQTTPARSLLFFACRVYRQQAETDFLPDGHEKQTRTICCWNSFPSTPERFFRASHARAGFFACGLHFPPNRGNVRPLRDSDATARHAAGLPIAPDQVETTRATQPGSAHPGNRQPHAQAFDKPQRDSEPITTQDGLTGKGISEPRAARTEAPSSGAGEREPI